jgi:hypothetical protein
MDRYQICVALDDRFGPVDVSLDVRTDQQHPFLKHKMQIATSPHGRAVLILTFTAGDLWTAILTSMALVRQSGYVPVAVQARAATRRFRTERLARTAHVNGRQLGEFDDWLDHRNATSPTEDTDAVGGWG